MRCPAWCRHWVRLRPARLLSSPRVGVVRAATHHRVWGRFAVPLSQGSRAYPTVGGASVYACAAAPKPPRARNLAASRCLRSPLTDRRNHHWAVDSPRRHIRAVSARNRQRPLFTAGLTAARHDTLEIENNRPRPLSQRAGQGQPHELGAGKSRTTDPARRRNSSQRLGVRRSSAFAGPFEGRTPDLFDSRTAPVFDDGTASANVWRPTT